MVLSLCPWMNQPDEYLSLIFDGADQSEHKIPSFYTKVTFAIQHIDSFFFCGCASYDELMFCKRDLI